MRLPLPCLVAWLAVAASVGRADPPAVDRFGDPLPAGAVARLGTARLRCGGVVLDLAVTHDGKRLASSETLANVVDNTAATAGPVRVWDAATGKELVRLQGTGPVRRLRFSPSGATLVTADALGAIATWGAATGKVDRRFTPAVPMATGLALAPDGGDVFVAGPDGTVRQLSAETGKEARRYAGPAGPVAALAVGETHITAVAADGTVNRWGRAGDDLPPLKVSLPPRRPGGLPAPVALAADGTALAHPATADGKTVVEVWDLKAGAVRRRVPVAGSRPVNALALSPTGKVLAVCTQGADAPAGVRVWDVAAGEELAFRKVYTGFPVPLALAEDDRRLVFAGFDPIVRAWDFRADTEAATAATHQGPVFGVAYLAGGKRVVTVSSDRTARVWDAATGKELARFAGHETTVGAVAALPDGSVLTGGYDGAVLHWKIDDAGEVQEIRRFDAHPGSVVALAVSPDGKYAAGGGSRLLVWEVATGKLRHGLAGGVSDVAFAPDGRTLAAASHTGPVQLWDVETGKVVHALRPDGHARQLAFAPDGRTLYTAGTACQLWEVATGQLRHEFPLPRFGGTSLAVSPDGALLAAGAAGRVGLYAAATGQELGGRANLLGTVRGIAFAPDGRTLTSAGSDSAGYVWDVAALRAKDVPPGRQAAADVNELWKALAGPDARRAYQAVLDLAAAGEPAVEMLKEKLPPAEAPAGGAAGAEKVAQGRALEALERMGTAEARAVLAAVARGAPGAWLTEAARAAQKRLAPAE